jgi:large repetitive protein
VRYYTNDFCSINSGDTSNIITMSVTGGPTNVSITTPQTTVCAGNNIQFTATPVGGGPAPSYQWQIDGVNAGTNSPVFSTILNDTSNIRVIMVSNAVCGPHTPDTSNIINVKVPAALKPAVSISLNHNTPPLCAGRDLQFQALAQNAGTIAKYQWQVNGVNAGINSSVFNTSALQDNDQVKVILTSNYICRTSDTANSNIIQVDITPVVVPNVSITGNTVVNQGAATTLTATISNGGPNPMYLWQEYNDAWFIWQEISLAGPVVNYTPSATGRRVRCMLVSDAVCAQPNVHESNVLVFTVNAVTGINPTPASGYGIRYYPNPVQSVLYIDSLNLADKWQTMTITDITGKVPVMNMDIRNKSKITVQAHQLARGMYTAVLRRKQGTPVYLKFIKL